MPGDLLFNHTLSKKGKLVILFTIEHKSNAKESTLISNTELFMLQYLSFIDKELT